LQDWCVPHNDSAWSDRENVSLKSSWYANECREIKYHLCQFPPDFGWKYNLSLLPAPHCHVVISHALFKQLQSFTLGVTKLLWWGWSLYGAKTERELDHLQNELGTGAKLWCLFEEKESRKSTQREVLVSVFFWKLNVRLSLFMTN
jgi:hypothetical protein